MMWVNHNTLGIMRTNCDLDWWWLNHGMGVAMYLFITLSRMNGDYQRLNHCVLGAFSPGIKWAVMKPVTIDNWGHFVEINPIPWACLFASQTLPLILWTFFVHIHCIYGTYCMSVYEKLSDFTLHTEEFSK